METGPWGSSQCARSQPLHPGPVQLRAPPFLACAPPLLSLRFPASAAMFGEEWFMFTCSMFTCSMVLLYLLILQVLAQHFLQEAL